MTIIDIRGRINLSDGKDFSSKARWVSSLLARVGLPTDNFLPYVTGGIAWTERNNIYSEDGTDDSLSNNKMGWTSGAGIEYAPAWAGNWSGRLEYRYMWFGEYTDSPAQLLAGPEVNYRNQLSMNTIMCGISYHLPVWH